MAKTMLGAAGSNQIGSVLAAMAITACASILSSAYASAAEIERVSFPSVDAAKTAITGYFIRPTPPAKPTTPLTPAILAMHGCSGLFARGGDGDLSSRHTDWSERWTAAGYAVLFPDSYGSRNLTNVCSTSDRGITPRTRALDAFGAATWLSGQPGIDASRLALVGWSNGGSTALWADDARRKPRAEFRTMVAFYPGCSPVASDQSWRPRVPLTILIGAADDWTPARPCQALADQHHFRISQYPGAYHDFDAPSAKIRVRTGLAFTANGNGIAHSGTDPAARAAAIAEVTSILAEALK